ncbi:protein of unknown function [Alteromonadaceae bacterium Bs31]|nr:protein of unknown function [Alteromonadaceae bacterium Bs31]
MLIETLSAIIVKPVILWCSSALTAVVQVAAQAPMQIPGNNQQVAKLLGQLHDPVLPSKIGIWPPAPGWWLLVTLGVVLIAFLLKRIHSGRRFNLYRREALKALEKIKNDKTDDQQIASALSGLLKQTFISASPGSRNLIAQFYGTAWQNLVHACCTLEKLPFEQQQALNRLCGEGKYQKSFDLDTQAAFKACKYWISKHKPLKMKELQTVLQHCGEVA